MSLDKILPNDIISIIFKYKHKFEMIETLNYIENPDTLCMNCDKKKLCLVACRTCNKDICYECRYTDLNGNSPLYSLQSIYNDCDKCDLRSYDFSEVFFSEDEEDIDNLGMNDWYNF